MKIQSHWRSLLGLLSVAACSYFLGCEPNEILDALPDKLRPDMVLPGESGTTAAQGAFQGREPTVAPNSPIPTGPVPTDSIPAGSIPAVAASGQFVSTSNPDYRGAGLPDRTHNSILIATFNIQVLGRSKMSKPGIPERLAQIIRQFDVVAIQEVRDNTNSTIPLLMQYINAASPQNPTGARYDYLISRPLGRTSSKEQYVYIYNTQTIIGSPEATYIVDDTEKDYLHREPFVARFVTRIPVQYHPFTFTLVNLHTDPDEVAQEIPVMHTVLKAIRDFEYQTAREDDVLLLGDLNVAPKDFGELGRMPDIFWVANEPTNTARSKIYDNIIFDSRLTNEYTGRTGVLQLNQLLGITREEELALSDHLPVWAEFSITEQPHSGDGNFVNSANGLSVR